MSAANDPANGERSSSASTMRVTSAFLILDIDSVPGPLEAIAQRNESRSGNIRDAADGLRSVVSAATLPFQLAVDAVQQRRFDRILSAERIRSLNEVGPGEKPSEALEKRSAEIARSKMAEFLHSPEGSDFMRDAVLYELNRSLNSTAVSYAAQEMLNQALISAWGVFEHFASRFIIERVNDLPTLAKAVLSSPELKAYFGKPLLDLEALDEHGFDLTRSMGSMIFRGKRLDNLGIVRSIMAIVLDDAEVREALGPGLWMLNQRRHLLTHKRGLVDREYLARTGDSLEIGQRLAVTSEDLEGYLLAVQRAIIAVATAAELDLMQRQRSAANHPIADVR